MNILELTTNEVRLSPTHSVLLIRHKDYFTVHRHLEFNHFPELDPLTLDDGVDIFLVTPDFPHPLLYISPEARTRLSAYRIYLPTYIGTLDADGLWLTPQANVSQIRNEIITICSNLVAADNKEGGAQC